MAVVRSLIWNSHCECILDWGSFEACYVCNWSLLAPCVRNTRTPPGSHQAPLLCQYCLHCHYFKQGQQPLQRQLLQQFKSQPTVFANANNKALSFTVWLFGTSCAAIAKLWSLVTKDKQNRVWTCKYLLLLLAFSFIITVDKNWRHYYDQYSMLLLILVLSTAFTSNINQTTSLEKPNNESKPCSNANT